MDQSSPIRASLPSMDLLVTSDFASTRGTEVHNPARFTVLFPNTPMLSKVVKCVPKIVGVPRMFYNVDTTNNRIGFAFNGAEPGFPIGTDRIEITLPLGLYTADRLVREINSRIPPVYKPENRLDGRGFALEQNDDLHILPYSGFYEPANTVYQQLITVWTPRDSELYRVLGWHFVPTNPAGTNVYKLLPSDMSNSSLPQLGGPQLVNVLLRCAGPQLINGYDGCATETLAVVPMTSAMGETSFHLSQDILVNDIDHDTQVRNYSNIEITILDARTNKVLYLPPVCTVSVVLKLYHVDTLRE